MTEHVVLPPVSGVVKFRNQDYEKIRNHCSTDGVLWEDPKFTPHIGDLVWKRPWEISSSPLLFQEEATQDVRLGILDVGYLAVAMQALTELPEMLHWVVPQDQQCSRDNQGVVHFRLWQLGTWYDICVDDRLPTKEGKLAYTHSSNENEFWCALLEKAYAKLYGSYKVLEGGHGADAMVDFTGGLSENIYLDHPPDEFNEVLLKAYDKNLPMCCAVSSTQENVCESVKVWRDVSHYTVTKVMRLEAANTFLIRLRDPKDITESTSTLADLASKWRSILDPTFVNDLNLETNNDREFWLTEENLKEHITTLSICHLTPDTFMNSDDRLGVTKGWWVNSFRGEWVRGVSAGGKCYETVHENFQYRITLDDPDDDDNDDLCSVVVALTQKNKTRQLQWHIGFRIFKVENPLHRPLVLDYRFFSSKPHNYGSRLKVDGREIVNRQKLSLGVYCIIPFTKERNEEGEFLLRVFTRGEVDMVKCEKRVSVVKAGDITSELVKPRELPVAEESRTDDDVVELFRKVSGKDLTVDWEGLKIILDSQWEKDYSFADRAFNVLFGKIASLLNTFFPISSFSHQKSEEHRFSKELCRQLISFMDENNSGRIGFDEFDQLWSQICQWKMLFRVHRKRKERFIEDQSISEAFKKAGFIFNKEVLGILIHRYTDEQGRMFLDDFIMCMVSLQMDFRNFNKLDKDNTGEASVTLDEWIRNSLL